MKDTIKTILYTILCVILYPIIYVFLLFATEKSKHSVYILYTIVLIIWCGGCFSVFKFAKSFTDKPAANVISGQQFVSIKPHLEIITTEITTAAISTTTTEISTEPPTAPNRLYNIDCTYNYNGRLSGKKGVYSGLWSGLEQKVNASSAHWVALEEWVGDTSELRDCNYEEDNFKAINGYGTVNWAQGGHDWHFPYSLEGSSDWGRTSCGVCAVAIVLSTLSGEAVTPPEVALAANILIGDSAWEGDILLSDAQAELIRMAGFHVDTLPYYFATKEKMDDCLNHNGMVIFVTSSQTWASGGNHYIVVRNLKDDLYYTADSGKNPQNGFTYDEISEGYIQQKIVYIYPKEY